MKNIWDQVCLEEGFLATFFMFMPFGAKRGRYIVNLPNPLSRERNFARYMGNP